LLSSQSLCLWDLLCGKCSPSKFSPVLTTFHAWGLSLVS
jgi:hypothetical protein